MKKAPAKSGTIKWLSRLEDVRRWSDLWTAAAPLFPRRSIVKRAAESAGPMVAALQDKLLTDWVNSSYELHDVDSRPLLCLIRRHGTVVTRWPSAAGDQELIAIGRVHVTVRARSWSDFVSTHAAGDLAVEILAHLASVGRDSALRISCSATNEDWSASFEPTPPDRMSAQASAIVDMLRPELAFGPRCVLLHGPSGLGKSTAARQIARLADGPVVVLDAGIVGRVEAWTVAAELRPAALIVEDIDHAICAEAQVASRLLGQLESIRSICGLIVVTANSRPATPGHEGPEQDPLTRSGRVDHVFEISELDPGLAAEIGVALPLDVLDLAMARGFSAADLAEVVVRWRAHPGHAQRIKLALAQDLSPRAILDGLSSP